jgi:hypothetical protein
MGAERNEKDTHDIVLYFQVKYMLLNGFFLHPD